jgi:ribosomal protein S18 acetylase RimI-like enzyme
VHFTVRDFDAADFDTLWRIDQKCFAPEISYSRAELRFYMRRSGAFTLVAESAGEGDSTAAIDGNRSPASAEAEIGGFLVAETGPRARGHIITIDVIASCRRLGVGTLLLDAAEARLRSAACGAVELETAVDNRDALLFYKRHGYSVIKTHPRYYSNGVDALVLEKHLR